ncbi:MAG: phosphatidylserine/phosphatidylglycerophosphate/cardiolipin synthase family protein [Deltaproteobacteria bacterium]|nr:phosphatidylserine/phosphatidylglycerophosphate/cardiolipin synthase family protein [Deltaproteobacteria bacterium]
MAIKSFISRNSTQVIDDPLPPCWHRRHPTADETVERVGGGLLSTGPQGSLGKALVELVAEAKDTVLIATFLFSDADLCDALLAAHARGVRVYMLTASSARLTSQRDDDFTAQMIADHQRLLDRLAGKIVLRSADCFHAKFVVVDHERAPRGWLSTANFNPALYRGRELGLELAPPTAQELAAWFSWGFWTCAQHELTGEKGRLRAVDQPPVAAKVPTGDGVLVTTPEHQILRAQLLTWIHTTKRELWLSSYALEANHDVLAAIIERAKAGVPVTVLTRPRPAVRDAVVALREAGARVIAHDTLHAKAVICDHGALIMTANIAAHGLDNSFEVGVVLDRTAREALRQTLSRWIETFPWILSLGGPRADHIGDIWLADQGKDDGQRQVVEQVVKKLDDIEAEDALALDDAPSPKFVRPAERQQLPVAVHYEWSVRAPHLPKGAKPLDDDTDAAKDEKHTPPAFQHKRQRYVVLEHEHDASAARARANELGAKVVLP